MWVYVLFLDNNENTDVMLSVSAKVVIIIEKGFELLVNMWKLSLSSIEVVQ